MEITFSQSARFEGEVAMLRSNLVVNEESCLCVNIRMIVLASKSGIEFPVIIGSMSSDSEILL